jgi:hypothetical protein
VADLQEQKNGRLLESQKLRVAREAASRAPVSLAIPAQEKFDVLYADPRWRWRQIAKSPGGFPFVVEHMRPLGRLAHLFDRVGGQPDK